ncbi:hypothetical protein ACFP3V_31715, partial [Streptacidiphilus monticola]
DELISLDTAGASATIAEIAEQLRKFGVRMHVMVQLLERINPDARLSLLQNASALSTTAGSLGSVRAVTEQWHGAMTEGDVADLPRYHHALSLTIGGRQIGPLTVRGPQPGEVFRTLHSPKQVGELAKATNQAVGARTAAYLNRVADKQTGKVTAFLTNSGTRPRPGRAPKPQRAAAVQLLKSTHTNTEYS